MVGEGGSTEEGGRRRRGLDGEGVPVVEGGREGARELRGAKLELLKGLIWGGEGRRSEFNGGLGSPAFGGWRRWCSWVWGWGIGKQTKGMVCGAICSAQARARTRAGALRRARHGGVAVAAARRFWARGTGGKGPARSQGAMEEALGRRVGDSATEKGGREASPRRRRRCRRWAAARTEQGWEKGDKGQFVITKNSRVLSVNKQ